MTQKETLLLMSYIYNLRCRTENEVAELRKNIRYKPVDVVDCSELASAITRLDTVTEITENILILLNLDKDDSP
ncbi:MAG: hypothetical protein NC548_62020 [Lachnospiraceae bacterium]|nr:hypothetical protein [Lachnospiraceae bacterium]MCM1230957.1 hypothetical protein [Ruminococcus flavefaciens]